MNGEGTYQWRALDGSLGEATNWSDLPDEMEHVIRFEPDYPPSPHTDKEHAYMDTFYDRLQEVLSRCRV